MFYFQDNENKMRSFLNDIYFGKTREIVGNLRTIETGKNSKLSKEKELATELRNKLTKPSTSY